MSTPAAPSAPDTAPMGLVSRFFGIITSPRQTFARVAAHPRWLGMLAVVVICGATMAVWFQSTEVGKLAMIDTSVKAMESFGFNPSEQMLDQMEKQMLETPLWRTALQTGLSILIFTPVMYLAIAGILFGVFSAALGGGATFRQVFATVVHGGVISTLGQLFSYPIFYLRESMTSATSLGVLLPMLAEDSFLAKFLGAIDLFTVWWVAVLAIGVAVLYHRKTRPVAISLFAVYGVIAAAIAAFQAMRSSS